MTLIRLTRGRLLTASLAGTAGGFPRFGHAQASTVKIGLVSG